MTEDFANRRPKRQSPYGTQRASCLRRTLPQAAAEDLDFQEDLIMMADLRQETFRQLRSTCAQLLPLRSSASKLTEILVLLLSQLDSAHPVGLAGCLDYVLFPLLFLADSICAVRGGSAPGGEAGPPAFPAATSSQVAERGLACCQALLDRCPIAHPTQLINLLQRFGSVAALPRSNATEEVRMGAQLVDETGGLSANAAALDALKLMAMRDRKRSANEAAETSQGILPLRGMPKPANLGERPLQDLAWTQASERISSLLRQVLPSLCSHPRAAVRAAIPYCVMELVAKCPTALQPCMELLVELMLTLAQDPWPQVCNPCRMWLTQSSPLSPLLQLSAASLTAILDRLVAGLRRSVEAGQEAGRLHARRLASAFMAWPPHLTQALLTNPAQLSALCSALVHCFDFSPSAAALLFGLRANDEEGGGVLPGTAATGAPSWPAGAGPENPPAAVLLPRMPAGLALLGDPSSYEAVAGVARGMGRAASSAGGTVLHAPAIRSLATYNLAGVSVSQQALGRNALLVRASCEALGAGARSVGPRFSLDGRLLRLALLPLLERLADPCPSVAASAAAAVGSICLHCGPPTFQQLVADNADYIVDEACRQLRHLPHYPRAPHLFAALLRRAGVAADLLPLLAEPAGAALQGLSILARSQRPHLAKPFLQVLQETVDGTKLDADAALGGLQQLALAAEARLRTQRAAARVPEATSTDAVPPGHESPAGQASMDEIHDYFEAREPGTETPTFDNIGTVQLSEEEVESVKELRSRIHADAFLASTAADTAGPLLFSSNTEVVLGAMDLCCRALHTLAATTAALDVLEDVLWPGVEADGNLEAPPPTTPKLLPSVHIFWAPLMAALQDKRAAVAEQALHSLADMTQTAGGDFLARRFSTEAWPLMQAYLQHPQKTLTRQARPQSGGQARRASGPFGDQEGLAPAAVQKLHHAVLACIAAILGHTRAANALRSLTQEIAQAAVTCLSSQDTSIVQAAAAKVLEDAGRIDKAIVGRVLEQFCCSSQSSAEVRLADL
ncbi:hypothetical protein WJX84_006608 [Apatococcus fuscideae]|uniref:Uncharacterized protein n=1 Tax=Apatococcus fuscideae TaxID=2026836 RepID=A0AAW1TG62_9CHLO